MRNRTVEEWAGFGRLSIIVNKVTKMRIYYNKKFYTDLSQKLSQSLVIDKSGCYTKEEKTGKSPGFFPIPFGIGRVPPAFRI